MKTVLVTGGNRGIGLEICKQLDELGHFVILGSRDLEKGKEAAISFSDKVVVKQLDVKDEDSIRNLFKFVKADYGKLDVLINNAGIEEKSLAAENTILSGVKNIMETKLKGVRKKVKGIVPILRKVGFVPQKENLRNVPMAGVKQIMETNFYGPWRMIQDFIPLLLKSDNGQIINMSSGMGELGSLSGDYPSYRISKSSLNALTIMFAKELENDGIRVNAMCPGWVKTDMGGPDAPRDVSQGADTAVWLATENDIATGKFFRDRQEISW